jgi:hypothetical protein
MKTYEDIDDFIFEMFPQEYEKIKTLRKTSIDRSLESINAAFAEELDDIIKGTDEEEEKGKKKKGKGETNQK